MCGFCLGISPPEFDKLTLAVIRGRLVRYLMRSKEVVIFLLLRVIYFFCFWCISFYDICTYST